MESVEIAIVGGGLTGLSAGWRLALAGRSVAVLERFAIGHDRGSSHGATRIFRFAYADALYVSMAQTALPMWRELEAASGQEILQITGGLDVGPAERLDAIETAMRSCGASCERLGAAERRSRYPWIEAGDNEALYSPDTGVLAAGRTLEAMAFAARAAGATVIERTEVGAIELEDDGVVLQAGSGRLRARRCIVGAGAWAGPLLRQIAELPLRITREQVFYFRGADLAMPFIHWRSPARYLVPRFAGAAGVKVAEHMTGESTSAEGRSFEMDPEGAARVSGYVAETLPSLDPEPVAFETCLYTNTPDENFIIDAFGPLVVASPCSGHGFKFGPIVGEALACLATGREPPVPLDRFTARRFA